MWPHRRLHPTRPFELLPHGVSPLLWLNEHTFIHPVKDLVQVVLSIAAAVLFPHGPVLAAQDHQLPVTTPMRGKVRDLHDDRAVGHLLQSYLERLYISV